MLRSLRIAKQFEALVQKWRRRVWLFFEMPDKVRFSQRFIQKRMNEMREILKEEGKSESEIDEGVEEARQQANDEAHQSGELRDLVSIG